MRDGDAARNDSPNHIVQGDAARNGSPNRIVEGDATRRSSRDFTSAGRCPRASLPARAVGVRWPFRRPQASIRAPQARLRLTRRGRLGVVVCADCAAFFVAGAPRGRSGHASRPQTGPMKRWGRPGGDRPREYAAPRRWNRPRSGGAGRSPVGDPGQGVRLLLRDQEGGRGMQRTIEQLLARAPRAPLVRSAFDRQDHAWRSLSGGRTSQSHTVPCRGPGERAVQSSRCDGLRARRRQRRATQTSRSAALARDLERELLHLVGRVRGAAGAAARGVLDGR